MLSPTAVNYSHPIQLEFYAERIFYSLGGVSLIVCLITFYCLLFVECPATKDIHWCLVNLQVGMNATIIAEASVYA